jgi:hypothetical protein
MCDVLLPPGVNPTAVIYIYISQNTKFRFLTVQDSTKIRPPQ